MWPRHFCLFLKNSYTRSSNMNTLWFNVRLNVRAFNTNSRSRVQEAHLPRPNFRLKRGEERDTYAGFLLLIPFSAFALGTWQVKRKKWKEELIDRVMAKTTQPAIPINEIEDKDIRDLEYRRLSVKGEFEHSKEMYLGPRSLLVNGDGINDSRLMSTSPNNSVGFNVITPFVLSDTKERILVNRGWIPFPQKDPRKRPRGQIQGEIELEGVVRLSEPDRSYGLSKKDDVKVYLTRNVEDMAAVTESRPIFIDAVAESTIPGGPIGGQTRANFRNEHLSYIITWWVGQGCLYMESVGQGSSDCLTILFQCIVWELQQDSCGIRNTLRKLCKARCK